jgi:serine/threonine protein kinase/tetratricopeptide (TPR) repeat protein
VQTPLQWKDRAVTGNLPTEEAIFHAARAMASRQERQAYLEQACADHPSLREHIEAMLEAYEQGEDLIAPAALKAMALDSASLLGERPGATIDRYKLLEQIGEGGFGVVFMAEQTHPVKRKVALKVLKPGMDTRQIVARFEAERQALAMMDHPNIARVIDAGTTESSRPYFVMELVHGVPMTTYCDQNKLTSQERLKLFVQVCRAVQHAHQKGIIHRDLKPNNVLVTLHDGVAVPKVIDFGIAKAMGQELTDKTLFTAFAQLVGTPLYMSPEQAEMSGLDVDTRSDIYSLGVLLYELLTGTTPFDKDRLRKAAYEEFRRIIREEEPPKPSTRLSTLGQTQTMVSAQRQIDPKKLSQTMRGDLDWIVMKAMEKDRTRRYDTVNGLARDVERYLDDQPVEACPPSRMYRLRKLARRNKVALATAAVIAAALLLATAISTWQAVRARRAERQAQSERRRADEQAAVAQAVTEFQEDMLEAADPKRLLGEKVTVLQAAREAIKRLDDGALKDQPLVEAGVRNTISSTLRALAHYDEAEPIARKALELRRGALPAGHKDIRSSLTQLAFVLQEQGKAKEAEALLRETVQNARATVPTDYGELANTLQNLGQHLQRFNNLTEAEPLLREALTVARKLWPQGDGRLGVYVNNLGLLLNRQGKAAEAEPLLREGLEITRKTLPAGHPDTGIALENLGSLLESQSRLTEAEPLYRECLDIFRKAFPPDHPYIARSLSHLGTFLQYQGKMTEAEAMLRESLEIRRKNFGTYHRDVATGVSNLAGVLMEEGKWTEAEPLCRESLEIRRKIYPARDHEVSIGLDITGRLLRHQQRYTEAEALLREALEIDRRALPAGSAGVARTINALGYLLRDMGRLEEAAALLQEGLAIYRRSRPASVPAPLGQLAMIQAARQKLPEAESTFREVLALHRKFKPPDHPDTAATLGNLGSVLVREGRYDEADSLLREALEMNRRVLSPGNPEIGWTLVELGELRRLQGKLADAESLLREAMEIDRRALPAGNRNRIKASRALGATLSDLGRYEEAEALLLAAYDERQTEPLEPPGMSSVAGTRETIERLIELYDRWQKPQQATLWRSKLLALPPTTAPARTAPIIAARLSPTSALTTPASRPQ